MTNNVTRMSQRRIVDNKQAHGPGVPPVVHVSFTAAAIRIEDAIRDVLCYRAKIRELERSLAAKDEALAKAQIKLDKIESRENMRDAFACDRCKAKPGINCQAGCYAAESRCGGPTWAMRKVSDVEEFVAGHMKSFGEVVGPRHAHNTLIDSIKKCIALGNAK